MSQPARHAGRRVPTGVRVADAPACPDVSGPRWHLVTMIVLGLGSLAVAVLIFISGGPVGGAVTTLLAAFSFPLMIVAAVLAGPVRARAGSVSAGRAGLGGA